MLRTYDPVTKRYKLDAPKDYSKPRPMRPAPQQASPVILSIPTLQAHIKVLEAKLLAISKCTNVKAVKTILKG